MPAGLCLGTWDGALGPHLLGLDQLELHAAAGPGDEVGVAGVVQQGHQELPELQGASALVGRSLAEDAPALLLHLTWGGSGERTGVTPPLMLPLTQRRVRGQGLEDSPSNFSGTRRESFSKR